VLNDSIHYRENTLCCDDVPVPEIVAGAGTPVYVYSLRRALDNFRRIQAAFAALNAHIHYSAKANGSLALMRVLIGAGAGIDAVSGGEIYRALLAGASPESIVFAGVGKTADELRFALERSVGWFNVENVEECRLLNDIAGELGKTARVALRLNPDVWAQTHPHIATGHGGAKFGLTAETVVSLLARQAEYPHLQFAGIHVHIGSQLHDTGATQQAVRAALEVIAPYPAIRTVDIGGGLPVAYQPGESLPSAESFASSLMSLLKSYDVILEPGRSIIADAGMLVTRVLYVKRQGGQTFVIVDAGMTELIRPALYGAKHEIVSVTPPPAHNGTETPPPAPPRTRRGEKEGDDPKKMEWSHDETIPVQVVGPVCETTDVLGREVSLPADVKPGDLLAVLNAGAYGMVMASNYNARPRPPEVMVCEDGQSWKITRQRETWEDMARFETEEQSPIPPTQL
jgi:diaminopimelate decarboxylase